jgi:hypothetical protein
VLPVMQSERCNPVPIRMIPELIINQQGFWTLLKWDPSRVDATAQPKERRKSPRFSTACPVAVGQSSKRLGKISIKNETTKQSGDKCGYMQICVWCIIWIFFCGYNGNVNH